MADKVLRADMLPTLLPKLPRLLYTMRSSIETDIPMALQLEFANFVRDSSLREVRQLVLDSQFGDGPTVKRVMDFAPESGESPECSGRILRAQ